MSVTTDAPHRTDADRLLDGLVRAGAVSAEHAAAAFAQHRAEYPDGDATLLADHLVQHGLLTAFQAERALVDGPDKLELGRYLLVEPVGSSSVGTTYRAVGRPGGGAFAVRVLPSRSAWRVLQARKRLEAFASLPPHPAVVPFADVDTAGGRHYLAWPWADGETFDRAVLKNGPFAPADATRLFAELADGLRACHAAGLPHGLLRPKALLLGHDRQPRILDLGLGGILADNVADERSMVDTMALASGSAAMIDYTAPEILLDPTIGSPAADAYSFGGCLYFALTGLPPFPEERLSQKVIGHTSRSPVPVRTRNPLVPVPLADLIDRLMRKAPDERPGNFADIRAELRGIADSREMQEVASVSASVPVSVTARALAALGELRSGVQAYTRRAELPPASDVVDFDDVPVRPMPALPENDLDAADDTPLDPPAAAVAPPPPVERRLLDAAAGRRGSRRKPVEIPPPPAFDSAAARAARSVLFWKKTTDAVQLSAFGPPEVVPGQRLRVLVYSHLPDALPGVATLCRALNPDAELLGTGYIQRPVPRESTVQLHLSAADGVVPKPLVDFLWTGQTQARSFDVVIPAETAPGLLRVMLAAGWQRERVGEVPFELEVVPRSH